jgi:hypothetical protein
MICALPVFRSGKKQFLIDWTADGQRCVNYHLLGSPPFSLTPYKAGSRELRAWRTILMSGTSGNRLLPAWGMGTKREWVSLL